MRSGGNTPDAKLQKLHFERQKGTEMYKPCIRNQNTRSALSTLLIRRQSTFDDGLLKLWCAYTIIPQQQSSSLLIF
jgi:hypothetical protein